MRPSYEQHSKGKLIGTVIAIIVIAGIVLVIDHLKSNRASGATPSIVTTTAQPTQATPVTMASTTSATPASSASSGTYKDGTYSATSRYYVPHGNEEITVDVTLKNGVITDSSVTNSEGNRDSASYQQDFTAAYKNYVVGKHISTLKLGNISGASDTTHGFNDALTQIVSKAQA